MEHLCRCELPGASWGQLARAVERSEALGNVGESQRARQSKTKVERRISRNKRAVSRPVLVSPS